jgi:hypothetical protein
LLLPSKQLYTLQYWAIKICSSVFENNIMNLGLNILVSGLKLKGDLQHTRGVANQDNHQAKEGRAGQQALVQGRPSPASPTKRQHQSFHFLRLPYHPHSLVI